MNSAKTRRLIVVALVFCILLRVVESSTAGPRVVPTERYQREMLRLMIVEANRVAQQLDLDEQLPISRTNLTLVWLIPAGKTWGPLGAIDTRSYAYSMHLKDSGVVVSGITRKGFQDFHDARARYIWPMRRYDTNHAYQTAAELMGKAGVDFNGLNRDCTVRIDAPNEGHFSPIYMVTWFQKSNTFHIRTGRNVASIEFIDPAKKIRQLSLTSLLPDSKYNVRKPAETVDFLALLTPENSREAVLNEIEMATNYVKRIEDLGRGGLPESDLIEIWQDYTNAPFPTNILGRTNALPRIIKGRAR